MSGLKLVALCRCASLALLIPAIGLFPQVKRQATLAPLHARFLRPPDDARIMMRWWWFGAAVEKPELARELRVMKAAGIGGVEIQPVYPLELDDTRKGLRNLPYGSAAFLDAVRFASAQAAELGMRVDVTLGSGWPYGGPDTRVTEAAGRLRIERVALPSGQVSAPLPPLENGEQLLAVFLTAGDGPGISRPPQQVTEIRNGRIFIPAQLARGGTLLCFISGRTGQQVKRPAVGAEGFVLDHYDRAAILHHLKAVGDPLLRAFGAHPPHAVFSDSLEVFGTDWTGDFLEQFRRRRGYDLTRHLPALAADVAGGLSNDAPALRHDWGETLSELAEERYLTPVREWAHAHGTLFRSQTYGEPPVILSSNALVDLPEGEHGPEWRMFNAARWASSASHLYRRAVTSSETWTWLHAPSFRAAPLDMKAEADLHFLQGINQLIGHGWPYSPPAAGEPGWRFYASAAFNEHNPWFQVMPEIARYLQRISYLLRQGSPANDVAIYLPTDDAWAQFRPGRASVDQAMEGLLGPVLISQVLNAGFNFDFIDDRAIEAHGVPYRLLILPGVERIPLSTLKKIQSFVRQGGGAIATRRLPSLAPGFLEPPSQSAEIAEIAGALFRAPGNSATAARFLPDENMLGSALAQMLTPDFATGAAAPAIGFIHRKLEQADIYFIANTSNRTLSTEAAVRISGCPAEWWDPMTGAAAGAVLSARGNTSTVSLELAPYESRLLVFAKDAQAAAPPRRSGSRHTLNLSSQWTVTFSGIGQSVDMDRLHSWSDDAATRYYSGEAVYEKTFELPSFASSGDAALLDFGSGEPVAQAAGHAPGMRALLESPVRESAIIYVNGQSAGALWHPPYQVDVTRLLHAGENRLRIVVANLAINEMAGRALPDYKLLNLRYGTRFVPQGFEGLHALPAGILQKVELVVEK